MMETPKVKAMNILIVDDERDQLESLRRGLRSESHQTVEALNAEAALYALKSSPSIDLVLTDYSMPGMDGLWLLERIRENYGDLPVILMTAFGDKHLVVQALQNHCNGYLEKPFSLLQLLGEIKKVTSDTHTQRAQYSKAFCRMAHQINNPLMAIIGSAELSLDDAASDGYNPMDQLSRLKHIVASAKRIQRINHQVMGLGRIMAEEPSPVDLLPILKQCLKMYEDLLKKKRISVNLKTGRQRYIAMVSHFAMEQAFKNLLLNAVEALEGCDGKQLTLRLRHNRQNQEIQISIEDNGIGIEPNKLPKVFTQYYTSKSYGNGIGLAVVKQAVEQFNGRIKVKSRLGEGTHFGISLPAISPFP